MEMWREKKHENTYTILVYLFHETQINYTFSANEAVYYLTNKITTQRACKINRLPG